MSTNEARKIMEDVQKAYKEITLLHLVAVHLFRLLCEEGHEDEEQIQVEIWFALPKLRIDSRPLTLHPEVRVMPPPETIVVDEEHEYHLFQGRWIKWKKWEGTPNLLDMFGLTIPCLYSSVEEEEFSGHPVWRVQGECEGGAQATWLIDKRSLFIEKFALTKSIVVDLDPTRTFLVNAELKVQQAEVAIEIPEEKFKVPPNIPVVKHPAAWSFARILDALAWTSLTSTGSEQG